MQSVCTCSVSTTLSLLVRGDNLGNLGQTTPKFHWNLTQNYHFWDHFPQAPERITDDLTTWMDRLKPYWSHSSLCWQITAHLAYLQPVSWTTKPHYPFKYQTFKWPPSISITTILRILPCVGFKLMYLVNKKSDLHSVFWFRLPLSSSLEWYALSVMILLFS